MVSLTQVQKINATPLRPPSQPRFNGPHILRLSGLQLRARLKQLEYRGLTALFLTLSKLSKRNIISQIAKRFKTETIYIDEECSKKLKLLSNAQLKELSSSACLTDFAICLTNTLEIKLVDLPESRTICALADPRNIKKFRALAMISPAEQQQMRKEQEAQILFYFMANPCVGVI